MAGEMAMTRTMKTCGAAVVLACLTPALTVQQGFPALNPQLAVNPPVTSVDMRSHTPYYQHWNFGIEQQSTASLVLSVAYAGSKGTHLQVVTDQNQVPYPGPGDVQSRRPYPTFGTFTAIQNRGNSNYHSLQMKADKRLSRGLLFLSAFTWSKAINDLPEICCASPWPQNSYDLNAERGLSSFHTKHRQVNSVLYQIPFGKGRRFLHDAKGPVQWIAGGWQINSIDTFQTGSPFTATMQTNTLNVGSGTQWPNRLASGKLSNPTINQWFDPTAFAAPGAYIFGNEGRNILYGPPTRQVDMSFFKSVAFSADGARRLQFRAEMFNILNTPQFNNPNAQIGFAGVAQITSAGNPPLYQRTSREIQFALKLYF